MIPESREEAFEIAFSGNQPKFSLQCLLFGCSFGDSITCKKCGREHRKPLDGKITMMLNRWGKVGRSLALKIWNARGHFIF
jgi:hypothetical protein